MYKTFKKNNKKDIKQEDISNIYQALWHSHIHFWTSKIDFNVFESPDDTHDYHASTWIITVIYSFLFNIEIIISLTTTLLDHQKKFFLILISTPFYYDHAICLNVTLNLVLEYKC